MSEEALRIREVTRTTGRVMMSGRRGSPAPDLPVIVVQGATEGPVAVVTGNVHGDECVGIGVIRRLDAVLQQGGLHGTVVMYPSCNPTGLGMLSRHVPVDDIDLNRVFPGSARSTWTSRLAHALWRDITRRQPTVLIDLHADSARSIPYAIVDRPAAKSASEREVLGQRLTRLANSTGLTVLREYPDDLYLQFGLDRSLAGAMVNVLGVPAVVLEAGPRRVMDASAVDVAFSAVWGILSDMGMVEGVTTRHATQVSGVWRRASCPRARRTGILEPLVMPGERVEVGQVMAKLVSLSGTVLEDVRATEAGIVVSWVDSAWVSAGGVLGTLGVPDSGHV